MKADDILRKLMVSEEVKPKTIMCRVWLKYAVLGDVVRFTDGSRGIVINGSHVNEESIVECKAILITHYLNGDFLGHIASISLDKEVLL